MNNNYDHRGACFVITTPYQLIGAMSIVKSMNIIADLYIIDIFKDSINVANKLEKYGLFSKVIIVPFEKYRYKSIFERIQQVLNFKKEVTPYILNCIYDTFFFTNDEHILCLIQYALANRNPKMNYVLYDDGLGTYTKTIQTKGWKYKALEYVMGLNKINKYNLKIMVGFPDFFKDLPMESINPVEKMHFSSFFSKSNISMLNDIFSNNINSAIKERFVFFDECRLGSSLYINKDYLDKIDKCIKCLVDNCSYNDVICKSHPRSSVETEIEVKRYCTGEPVEVVYASMDNLSDKVLLGVFTTAIFTPKLMFDSEPIIISLHKMLIPDQIDFHSAFLRLKELYCDKDRLYAPETFNDYVNCLKRFNIH